MKVFKTKSWRRKKVIKSIAGGIDCNCISFGSNSTDQHPQLCGNLFARWNSINFPFFTCHTRLKSHALFSTNNTFTSQRRRRENEKSININQNPISAVHKQSHKPFYISFIALSLMLSGEIGHCYIFQLKSISGFSLLDVSIPSDCWLSSAISFLVSSFSRYFCHFSKRSFLSASVSSILHHTKRFISR